MTPKNLEREEKFLEKALKREKAIRYILAFALLVMTVSFLSKSTDEKTILTPFGYQGEEVSITKNKASQEYLKKVTEKLVGLGFTFNPLTVEKNFKGILQVAAPEHYGTLNKLVLLKTKQVKKNNVSSVFYPSEYKFDISKNRVVVKGVLKTYSGARSIFDGVKSYLFEYKINNQSLGLVSYSDVTRIKNPFEVKLKDK